MNYAINVAAGNAARTAYCLIRDCRMEGFQPLSHPLHTNEERDAIVNKYDKHFYECLAELLGDRLPRKVEPHKPLIPMNPAEREVFEQRTIMFGKHSGKKIWQIAEQDPEWLDWYARQEDELRKSINRYLLCLHGVTE